MLTVTPGLGGKRFPAATGFVGIGIDEFELAAHQVFLKIELRTLQVDGALGVNNDFHAFECHIRNRIDRFFHRS